VACVRHAAPEFACQSALQLLLLLETPLLLLLLLQLLQ
jgi:hypothetical protein